MRDKRPGKSYRKRAEEINRIYVAHSRRGLSNREIWRRYVYPVYAICERTFYEYLKLPARTAESPGPGTQPSLFGDGDLNTDDNGEDTGAGDK